MNPALRSRRLTPLGLTAFVLLIVLGVAAMCASGEPPASADSIPRSQFRNTAERIGRTAIGEFGGSRTAAADSAQADVSSTPAAGKPAELADLGWLAGRWVGKWGPRTAEQIWTSPQSGLMLGAFRVFEDNHTLLVEVFTLEQRADGVVLRFRHFTPDLVPWEKSAATQLTLQSYDSKKWVFLNSSNGEPKRSIIIRVDPDTYTLRSEISAGAGPMRIVEITFRRQGTPSRKSKSQRK
jgi:hypothetical protein